MLRQPRAWGVGLYAGAESYADADIVVESIGYFASNAGEVFVEIHRLGGIDAVEECSALRHVVVGCIDAGTPVVVYLIVCQGEDVAGKRAFAVKHKMGECAS